jgi:hypothetical protein
MKEWNRKRVVNHPDPESCGTPTARRSRSADRGTGRLGMELRKRLIPSADAVRPCGRQHHRDRQHEGAVGNRDVGRPDSTSESPEQGRAIARGGTGGKRVGQGEHRAGSHGPNPESGDRVPGPAGCAGGSEEGQRTAVHRPAASRDPGAVARQLLLVAERGVGSLQRRASARRTAANGRRPWRRGTGFAERGSRVYRIPSACNNTSTMANGTTNRSSASHA